MSPVRWRSSMLLLAICVAAILISFLRVITQPTPAPPASSYSPEPDGALALYTWLSATSPQAPVRLTDPATATTPSTLLVLQPVAPLSDQTRQLIDTVADHNGTVLLAGDSVAWLISARSLGITAAPVSQSEATATTPDGLTIPFSSRFSVTANNAQPLLTTGSGAWAGLRMPYRQGTLIVIASAGPFTNTGLSDPATARFVYRTIVAPAEQNQTVAFDEIDRPSESAAAEGPPTATQLLFQTPAGRALIYAAVLVFAFRFLTGRRLGPALIPRSAGDSHRTMYEHVQMLADLYRRAGQLPAARTAFSRHYARQLSRATNPAQYAESLARLDNAHTEAELISAVSAVSALASRSQDHASATTSPPARDPNNTYRSQFGQHSPAPEKTAACPPE